MKPAVPLFSGGTAGPSPPQGVRSTAAKREAPAEEMTGAGKLGGLGVAGAGLCEWVTRRGEFSKIHAVAQFRDRGMRGTCGRLAQDRTFSRRA